MVQVAASYHHILISEITVGERFRTDLGNIDELANNIGLRGLLHPIVIDRTYLLLAGGRRLEAAKRLGWTHIDAHFLDEVDPITAREIELEENVHRTELSWQERAKLTKEIDRLKREKYGEADQGSRPAEYAEDTSQGWSLRHTAEHLGVGTSTVRRDISLANALEVLPSLEDETSQTNALRKVNRLIEDLERELELRQRQAEVRQLASSVLEGDATNLIQTIPTASVDCIITDPPYGDGNITVGNVHRLGKDFDDSPEATLALLRTIGPELRRVLKPNGWLFAFFGQQLWKESIEAWKAAGFDVATIICIWVKSGPATGTVNWDYDFAPSWEPFLYASNRQLRLAHKAQNVFTYNPDTSSDRYHPNQKPIGLIQELLALVTQPGELVLDPFAGSGSVAVACKRTYRRFLAFEKDPRYVQVIKQRLTQETGEPQTRIDDQTSEPGLDEAFNDEAEFGS